MGSITAASIIDKAEVILRDSTNVQWSANELLGWLNDGQRDVALVKPESSTLTSAVQLVAGTKQSLGTGSTAAAIMLLRVVRNMGTSGAIPGNAIRLVEGEVLDAQRPSWHADTSSATVQNVIYDPRSPKQFYVYPPNTGTGWVEIMYSVIPGLLGNSAQAIAVDDIFANALLDYILYRAYSSPYIGNTERAAMHYTAFATALGANTQAIAQNSANLEMVPFDPAVPGAAK